MWGPCRSAIGRRGLHGIAGPLVRRVPGLHAKLYRAVVIGSGGHGVGVRGILRSIKAEAEHNRN
jgi:hypothetical protein